MPSQLVTIVIPADLSFGDLGLARDSDGGVSFDWGVIERICQASNLAAGMCEELSEDNVAQLIIGWYRAHISDGGTPDLVAEDLIAEVQYEDAAGQHASHPPGQA